MKQFIFAIIFAIICNSILGEEQFRQCNCEEQQKCIEEINDEIEGCIDECEVTVDLKSVHKYNLNNLREIKAVNESSNIGPCMEKHKKIISNFYDCLNDQCSTKESYLQGNESEKQKLPFFDFETILIKFLRPMAEKSHNQMKEIGKGLDINFVKIGLDLNKCAQDCAFKKVPNLNCFQKDKCSLKLTEQQLKESMGQCTKKTQPKQKINEVCECFQQNGVGNLKPFCEKLEKTEIPLEI